MSEPTLETLTRRLDGLEREIRRWKAVGVALLFSLITIGTMGQAAAPPPVQEQVTARRFVLLDRAGKVRAVLGQASVAGDNPLPNAPLAFMSDVWPVGLHIYGSDGRYRAGFSQYSDADGPGYVLLRDKDTGSQASILVGSGIASVDLDATQATWQEIERTSDRRTKRFNSAKTNEEFLRALQTQDYERYRALLTAWSHGGRSYLSLGQYPVGTHLSGVIEASSDKGVPSISLSDQGGIARAVLGHTMLENTRTGIGETRPPSSLVLFDKDGKVLWKVP